jgi:nucleoside-diphosphate-sugar epimerase
MNVLFLGATGLVGAHTVPFLKEKFDLTLAALGGGEVAGLLVTSLDICDWEETASAIKRGAENGEPFDAVVFCITADYKGHDTLDPQWRHEYYEKCIEVNVRGAYHAYQAAWEANVPKVVYVGSITAVMGHPRYEYLDADVVDRPNDLYASTKVFGEHVGRSYAYRPYWYKPKHAGRSAPMQVVCLRLGHPFVSVEHWRDHRYRSCRFPIAMEDVARAIECGLLADIQYGVYPVVSEHENPWVDPALYAELGYKPGWKFSDSEDRWEKIADEDRKEEHS